MNRALAFSIILLVITQITNAQEWELAKLIKAVPSNTFPGETRVTMHMPNNVPLGNWYTCDFFSSEAQMLARAHHVLRERTPSTNITLKDPTQVRMVLCSKG